MLFCTCMQVRNNMRTSNLLRFPCTSPHKITALSSSWPHAEIGRPWFARVSIPPETRVSSLGFSLLEQNRQSNRERRKRKKGNREREKEKRREKQRRVFPHYMASLPLGHHHHHQPAAATIHPSQPPQCQPQPEVPRRSSDMETDKVLPFIALISNPRNDFIVSSEWFWVVSDLLELRSQSIRLRSSSVAGVSTDLPVFRASRWKYPATPLIGAV